MGVDRLAGTFIFSKSTRIKNRLYENEYVNTAVQQLTT